MISIPVKELRVVRMTARMLVFVGPKGEEFFATKRVANEILSQSVDTVFVVNHNFFDREHTRHPMQMLATPSCW